jgi:hypothetical protein
MTTEAEREWRERVETLRNDKLVREQQQGTTFSQFAQAEAEEVRGRFSGHERATVVGASPIPEYPAAFHQRDPVPDEPALGVDINEMPPTGEAHEVERSIQQLGGAVPAPASAPLSDAVETTASPSLTDDDEPPRAA